MRQAYNLIWTELAEDTYIHILKNLLENRSSDEAIDFDEKVESLLEKLSFFKELCPPSMKIKNLRKCVVTKQTSLIYRIYENHLEIVTFIDNRSKNLY